MSPQNFPLLPLDQLNRPTVTTREAAFLMNRKEQTLRVWACLGGPIRPLRINGRLAWPVSEIKALLGVQS
jgi:hypothetical protein